MTIMVTKATPLPSLARCRPEKWELERMTVHQVLIRTCQDCKTTYRSAGNAWQCEHYHRPLP